MVYNESLLPCLHNSHQEDALSVFSCKKTAKTDTFSSSSRPLHAPRNLQASFSLTISLFTDYSQSIVIEIRCYPHILNIVSKLLTNLIKIL